MHYGAYTFSKLPGNLRTIETLNSSFSGVIGQRIVLSSLDITKVNRLYNCGKVLLLIHSAGQLEKLQYKKTSISTDRVQVWEHELWIHLLGWGRLHLSLVLHLQIAIRINSNLKLSPSLPIETITFMTIRTIMFRTPSPSHVFDILLFVILRGCFIREKLKQAPLMD